MNRKNPGQQRPILTNKPSARSTRPTGNIRPVTRHRTAAGQGLPVERLIRIERRKARNRAVTLSIFVMAIMLVTILLIITVMQQAKPSPRFIFIQEGLLAHTVQSTGLIIRDETTFSAPVSGLLKPLATEGSRAAKGQKLALIIPADKESQLKDLQQCESNITSLQTELMSTGKGAGAQAIFDESAAALSSIINLIRSDTSKGTLANMSAYSTSISVILEQRTTKLSTIDFKDSRIDALESQRDSLQKTLGLDAGTLVCQKPGIVSFKMDGLENVLKMELAASITAADYRNYIGHSASSATNKATVEKDEPVMRISSSLGQYLVFLLPDTDATRFKVDDFINISVPGDGLVIENCRCIRSETSGSDALLVFRTDRKVERISNVRTIQAELTISTTTGLKVPVSALINTDADTARATLMVVNEGFTRTCLVEIVDQDREYAIIKAIDTETYKPEVSSILVVNPEAIEAGEFIGD
jgi:hypothetical protein